MNPWIVVRTFIAFFLLLFGVGLMFAPAGAVIIGAAVAAIGLTFLFFAIVAIVIKGRQ